MIFCEQLHRKLRVQICKVRLLYVLYKVYTVSDLEGRMVKHLYIKEDKTCHIKPIKGTLVPVIY